MRILDNIIYRYCWLKTKTEHKKKKNPSNNGSARKLHKSRTKSTFRVESETSALN